MVGFATATRRTRRSRRSRRRKPKRALKDRYGRLRDLLDFLGIRWKESHVLGVRLDKIWHGTLGGDGTAQRQHSAESAGCLNKCDADELVRALMVVMKR